MQDRQGIGLYVPIVNQAFWEKLGPKLQETVKQLWADNLPGYRTNTAASRYRYALERLEGELSEEVARE